MTRRWLAAGSAVILVLGYLSWRGAPAPTPAPGAAVGQDPAGSARVDDPALYKRAFHPSRLYLPTLIEKFGDQYFIVDSYNNRVLFSDALDAPITAWKTLDDALSRPHSIAADGQWFVVDDTDADRINVYARDGDEFRRVQHINGLGRRPHRVLYDPPTQAFFVLASESQHISRLKAGSEGLVVEHTRHLEFLRGAYTRSMAIIGDRMFFVSGPGAVSVVDHRDGDYAVLETIPVPRRYASMNDIARIQGNFYLTATMNRMARCASLTELREDRCESVYESFGLRGNPYYFSRFDGRVFLGEVAGRDAILAFEANADGLRLADILYARR